MIRPHTLIFATLLTVTAGLGYYASSIIAEHEGHRKLILSHTADLERQLLNTRRQIDSTVRDVDLAEQQLSRLPQTRSDSLPTQSSTESEVQAWLARLRQLRQLASSQPDRQIPEMRLLTDDDWLRLARQVSLGSDEQRHAAFALLRKTAKMKFVPQLSAALMKFIKASEGRLPATTQDLAPYFDSPPDNDMLQRYAVMPNDAQNNDVILEIAAVDEAYDYRYRISSRGGYGSSSGFNAWIDDFSPRLKRARDAFRAANEGIAPNGLADVLPFVTPSFPPSTVEKLLKTEAERARAR